jgi:hypothetical protein
LIIVLIAGKGWIEPVVGGDIEIADHDHRKAGVGGGAEQLAGLQRCGSAGTIESRCVVTKRKLLAAHCHVD